MNLIERVKRILLSPQTEWGIIAAEPTTTAELYKTYIVPLAAIGSVAQFIGFSIVGSSQPGPNYRVPLVEGLIRAIVSYVLALGGTYLLAFIIDALAPSFNGQRNQIQALKLAAYSSTAYWVASVFAIIPALWILTLVGLYSAFLLYLGIPVLMKTPRDRALVYTGVIIISAFVVLMITYSISIWI